MKTLIVPKKHSNRLDNVCQASAGPHPNITGMKKLYWGIDAKCVKSGPYLYLVNKEEYDFYKQFASN